MANVLDHDALRPVNAVLTPKHERRYLKWLFYAFEIIAALIFAVFAFFAHTTAIFSFDIPAMQTLQQFDPPWFDILMRSVNWMGFGLQAVALVSAVIVVVFLIGWRWAALVAAVDAASIWAVNVLIGDIVGRPFTTPDQVAQVRLLDLTHPSFPSGHVTSYIAFYGFICYLIYTRVKPLWLRVPLVSVFGAVVVLVSPSRVYMGRHWPSDVVASIFFGVLWLALTLYVYRWGARTRFVREHFKSKPLVGA